MKEATARAFPLRRLFQSTNQPTDQKAMKKPTKKTSYHLTKHTTNHSINHPISQPSSQSTSTNQSTDQPTACKNRCTHHSGMMSPEDIIPVFDGVFLSSSDERSQQMMKSIGVKAAPWGGVFAIWNVDNPGEVKYWSLNGMLTVPEIQSTGFGMEC